MDRKLTDPRRRSATSTRRRSPKAGQVDVRGVLMDVAEALYAERGLEGVPIREIITGSGQHNSSVVHYHFGSRDGLILAIFERRMAQIDEVRLQRLAQVAAGSDAQVREWLAAYVLPFIEHITTGPATHYARFVLQVMASLGVSELLGQLNDRTASYRTVVEQLSRLLPHLPEEALQQRLRLSNVMLVAEVAAFEQLRDGDAEADAAALAHRTRNLLSMLVAALTAPYERP